MFKKITLLILALGLFFHGFASSPHAYFMYSGFNTIQKGPYLETYLLILGSSVNFKLDADHKFHGKVGVSMAFMKNGEIVFKDQYNIISPECSDTTQKKCPDFIDQQRIPLSNGDYEILLKIDDASFN